MKIILLLIAAIFAFVDVAFAHYRWTALIVNDTVSEDYYYVRNNTNPPDEAVYPVKNLTSTDMRCNVGGLTTGKDTHTATVLAGSIVGFKLDDAIFHHGPIAVYMSAVPSTSTVNDYDGSGPWFKINELGPVFAPGSMIWPADNLLEYSFEIPAKTPAGAYLLRIEHIGLHLALNPGAAEFYISCAQIVVIGNGGGSPGPTCVLPGAYKATDPGILINIYNPVPTMYTPPGPIPWSGN